MGYTVPLAGALAADGDSRSEVVAEPGGSRRQGCSGYVAPTLLSTAPPLSLRAHALAESATPIGVGASSELAARVGGLTMDSGSLR